MLQTLKGKFNRQERAEAHDERNQRLLSALRKHVGDAVFMEIVSQIERK
jgi:hypothetical protein